MIFIYGKPNCKYCEQAKLLLEAKGVEYEYIDVSEDEDALAFLIRHGLKTVPQCYDDTAHIGGYTELDYYIKHIGT